MSRQLLQLLLFISLLASTFTFEVTFSELLLVIVHALLTIMVLLVWTLMHFSQTQFFDVSGSNVEIILGGVRFCYGFLRSRPMMTVYHFVTCNPPILLPGSLFAMIFLSPGLVGLLITEIIVSLRTLCDRVTR